MYVSLKKTTNAPKKFCRFFKIFSRFRRDMMFLTPDLESTQNLASYRTFRGPKSSLLVKLEFENRFWRKTGFCCSLWTERCSEKMNITTKKFIFESTYHILDSGFFFDPRWITPFRFEVNISFLRWVLDFSKTTHFYIAVPGQNELKSRICCSLKSL